MAWRRRINYGFRDGVRVTVRRMLVKGPVRAMPCVHGAHVKARRFGKSGREPYAPNGDESAKPDWAAHTQ